MKNCYNLTFIVEINIFILPKFCNFESSCLVINLDKFVVQSACRAIPRW